MRRLLLLLTWSLAFLMFGCAARQPKIPGESDIEVSKVEIEPEKGNGPLKLDHEELFPRLGMRKGALTSIAGYYSVFREAEDKRRIQAFWQQYGYFDVEVSDADVVFKDAHTKAEITYRVKEGERYTIGDLRLVNTPQDEDEPLKKLAPLKTGDKEIDLELFRHGRIDMQEKLRRDGYGHANVYSRAYVDKHAKTIAWYYFVDAGPKTRIGSIAVDGNKRVPAADIIRRSGLHVGDPYQEDLRDRVVRDLLDSGSFAAAFVRVDTDTKFIVPGVQPDTGGELRDEQIDKDGNFVPRKLPEDVNVTIHVVEAPRFTIRIRASAELDPTRVDTGVGATLFFRDLFAPLHHLMVEGRIGYGWLFERPLNDRPSGLYGEALIRSIHSGVLGRLGDLRITAHYRSDLFPGYFLHHFEGGPGVRTTFAKGLFLDVDLFAKYSRSIGYGPFDAATRDALRLPSSPESYGPELQASIIWDERDSPVEAMSGYMLALRTRLSPGKPIATHRYFSLLPEVRGFIPLGKKLAIGLRASGGWDFGNDSAGVPLDARLFGGGAYGMRGFGRDQLSPEVGWCVPPPYSFACASEPVGGLSVVETTAELRFLPPQKPYGAVAFADFGGASGDLNPFALGPSFDAGLGLRLRLWYLPANVDVAYLIVKEGVVQVLHDHPFRVFFRIGEAF